MRRSKVTAAVAALGLIGFSIFGAVSAAYAAPLVPVINGSGSEDPVVVHTPNNFVITGTGGADLDGPAQDQVDTIYTVYVTTDGENYDVFCQQGGYDYTHFEWSCVGTIPLEPGYNYFYATATNGSGETSAPSAEVPVNYVDQPPPNITSPSAFDILTTTTPLFTGTGPTLGTVSVRDGSPAGPELCSSSVAANGTWSCESSSLSLGAHSIIATARDSEGFDYGLIDEIDLTIAAPEPPTVDQMFDPWITSQDEPQLIQGNMDVHATVVEVWVSQDDITYSPLCTISIETVDVTFWFCSANDFVGTISEGTHYLRASSTDGDGITTPRGPPAIITGVAAPTVTSPSNGFVSTDNTPTFTGTVEGDSITIYGGPASEGGGEDVLCSDNLIEGGQWSCTSDPLPDGEYEYLVEASPGFGVVAGWFSITIDASLAKPTMDYTMLPGGISVTGTGSGPSSEVSIDLWRVTIGTGESEDGEVYQHDFVDTCVEGEGEGDGEQGSAGLKLSDFELTGFGGEVVSCDFTGLAPGIWNVYSSQRIGENNSEHQNDYFRVPTTPTIDADLNADRSVTIHGTAQSGTRVFVETSAGTDVCNVLASGSTWSCSVEPGTGSHSYRAFAEDVGFAADTGTEEQVDASFQGLSAYSGVTSIQVPAPATPTPGQTPTPGPTATPTPTPQPIFFLSWLLKIGGGGTEFMAGDGTTLEGDGLPAGATVDAELHSTPVHLGSTVVAADGTFSLPVVIPEDAEPGDHKFVVTVTADGQEPSTVEQPITVLAPPVEEPAKATGPVSEKTGPAGNGSTFFGNRNDPATPTALTEALSTVEEIIRNPVVMTTAAAAGVALLVFVALPAELLNATLSEQYGRLFRRRTRVKPTLPWFIRFRNWLARTPILGGIAVTIAAAWIFGFADPNFGFDVASARVVLACGIALFLVGYVANALTSVFVGRRWQLDTVMELKPLALILTAVGVVISRLLEFSPGFLIGLILGVALAGRTTNAQQAKTGLVRSGITFFFAIAAWVIYSFIASTSDPENFWAVLTLETLVATTTEGLTMLLVGLLPFRFLEGASIFQFSKPIWAISYIIAAGSFIAIVVPSASNWGEVGDSFWLWAGIVGTFAALALVIYLYFRFWAPPFEEDEPVPSTEEPSPADATR